MSPEVHVGVSGFSYPSWKGRFYPKETKAEEFLSYYSQRLDTVEINSSFYASPAAAVVRGWGQRTRDGFTFSFKAPRQITHIQRLAEASIVPAKKFSDTLSVLGAKRGPTLFQLPPYSKCDLALLEGFLSGTEDIKERVFEFRHESWLGEATFSLLERNGAGFCVAETEDMKPVLRVTGGMGYYRLRMDAYSAEEVDRWADVIGESSRGVPKSYVYLRHDETGENAVLAQRLAQRLSG